MNYEEKNYWRIDVGIVNLEGLVKQALLLSGKIEEFRKTSSSSKKKLYTEIIVNFGSWRRLARWILNRECGPFYEIGKYTFIDEIELERNVHRPNVQINEEKVSAISNTLNLVIERIGLNSHSFGSSTGNYFAHKDLGIDLDRSIIRYKDNPPHSIKIGGKAYLLLKLFIKFKGQVVPHEEIMNTWGKKTGADSSDLFRSVKESCIKAGMPEGEFRTYFLKNNGYGLADD